VLERNPISLTAEDATRFWRYAQKTEGCWTWQGIINQKWGYGYFSLRGTLLRAHRVAYVLERGMSIPDDKVVDHLCRNRACVRPDHLEVVTQQENCRRGMTGRATGTTGEVNKAKTHCPKGHPYSGDNLRTRNGRRNCAACSSRRSRLHEENAKRTGPIEVPIVILGPPRTKKTSQRIARNRKTGQPFILPSRALVDWSREAVKQIRAQWPMITLTTQVAVRAVFYRQRAVGDLINYCQALADALEAADVVFNDKLIVSWDGTRLGKDAKNPRIEVMVTEFQS
jgi:Holliday junction resolvase RusA-like endonuclease